ncbi:hypothetical protein Prudu_595S000400, partial [Prunus dulcis]
STAKGVRRHGVDPNRSCNEEVMLSLSSRFCPAADLRSLSTSPRPPHLEPISAVVTVGTVTQPPFFSDQHQPRGCRNLAGKPWFSTTVRPNATRTSSSDFSSVSPPNRSSKAPGARQDCKRDLRRVKAIEVRGIHHRASHSFRTTKGDSAEFSAEV